MRSQTSTEYLIITAVVIIIAIIVIGVLGGIPGIGGGNDDDIQALALGTQKVAVTSYAISDYDTTLTIRNSHSNPIEVQNIVINGEHCGFFDAFTLSPGKSQQVVCTNTFEVIDSSASFSIVINWIDTITQSSFTQNDSSISLSGPVANKYLNTLDNHPSYYTLNKGCYNTSLDPIPICTCYDLNLTRLNLGTDHTLQNSIDFERCMQKFGDAGWTSGSGWDPINGTFAAVFDGNEFTINNLYINRPNENEIGLFENTELNTAEINNLGVTGTVFGANFTGMIVGIQSVPYGSEGHMENSYSHGLVSGYEYVGGLAGYSEAGTILLSHSYATVNGTNKTGGIVGQATNFGTFQDLSFFGTVYGVDYTGGIAGRGLSSTMSNNIASSKVFCLDGAYCGGLIGEHTGSLTGTNTWVNHSDDTATGCVGQSGTLVGTSASNCSP